MCKTFLVSIFFCFSALFLPVFSQTEESQSLADEGETVFLTDSLQENVKENAVSEEITLFLQENLKETLNVKSDLSPFIFRNSNLDFKAFSLYRQDDVKNLSYKKTRALISTIPENNKLMRQERIWRVSSKILAGLTTASLVATIYYYNDDSPRKYTNSGVSILTFSLCSIFTGITANNKLQQGVDNYNYNITKQQ
ncbi:MAG: hypothetical protein FWF51_07255 [Chitinivibrionia bacterium]|nr:hypothetical protein [Chitinivibrionia bacterium]